MSELEKVRDHARRLAAAGAHGDSCPIRTAIDDFTEAVGAKEREWPLMILSCDSKEDHHGHEWERPPGYIGFQWPHWCLGICSGCMPEGDRQAWRLVATIIDARLAEVLDNVAVGIDRLEDFANEGDE